MKKSRNSKNKERSLEPSCVTLVKKVQRRSTPIKNYIPLKLEKYCVLFWQIQILPTSSCVDMQK